MAKSSSGECPVPLGTLLIIGGKENKGEEEKEKLENCIRLEILQAFVDLIKKKDPVVEVITSASSEGSESFAEYKRVFKELGITNVGHMHHENRKDVLDDPLEERLAQADAFFFSGGDQLLLTYKYGGTPFLKHLKERYIKSRIVVAGTSAGAMAMSTPMIFAGSKEVQEVAGEIKVTTGLEFLKDVCIDTHFVERGRFVRLAQVIATNPSCIGMGVEEDTAVVVRDGLQAEVIGTGIVIMINGFNMMDTNIIEFAEKKSISIHNLRVDLLSRGEHFIIPQMNPPHK